MPGGAVHAARRTVRGFGRDCVQRRGMGSGPRCAVRLWERAGGGVGHVSLFKKTQKSPRMAGLFGRLDWLERKAHPYQRALGQQHIAANVVPIIDTISAMGAVILPRRIGFFGVRFTYQKLALFHFLNLDCLHCTFSNCRALGLRRGCSIGFCAYIKKPAQRRAYSGG